MKYTDIAKAALVLVLGVMTSTAFAANLYEEGFESIDATTNILAATPSVTPPWSGGADDVSTVVVGVPDEPAVGYPLPAAAHTKVLQLNTEGGTLTNTLASAASFASASVWVDTMVKCVPSEDLPDFGADQDIKVAVYAYVKEITADPLVTETNLAIYHGVYDPQGVEPYFYTTNTITDIAVSADDWYRLTIELVNGSGENQMQAFKVSIDGVTVTNAAAYSDDWNTLVNLEEGFEPDDGPWFLSAGCNGTTKDNVGAVQFKGTGFIDDLVVTAVDPLAIVEPPAGFVVTQSIGANGSSSDATSPITVTGVSTTLTYTAADFYEIAALTTNGTAVAGAAGSKFKTIDIYGATAVTSSFAVVAVYGDQDNVEWFNINGWSQDQVVPGLDYDQLEMLNVAATNAAAGATIEITGIEIAANGDVMVTIAIDRTMSLGAINGNVCLYGWTDLGGTPELVGAADVAGSTLGATEDPTKEFTFTGAAAGGKKFFKAVIEDPALRTE